VVVRVGIILILQKWKRTAKLFNFTPIWKAFVPAYTSFDQCSLASSSLRSKIGDGNKF